MKVRKAWFVAGGVLSILWGLFHVVMFLPVAFDPSLVPAAIDDRGLSEGLTSTDLVRIADLLTLFNNALVIYMVGIGLLTVFGAKMFAASRLGTGLLVIQIVFWVTRIVVPLIQAGRADIEWNPLLVTINVLLVVSLAVYVIPLFVRPRAESPAGNPSHA